MWNDHSRYSYNKAINILNDNIIGEKYNGIKAENCNTYYSKTDLRDLITPHHVCSRTPWILETPKHIREASVFEAHKNLKSSISNLRNGHINHFNLQFKKRKQRKWTIGIPKASLKIDTNGDIGVYEERTTNFRVRTTEQIKQINNDCTLHFDGLYYYLCIPEEKQIKTNKSSNWVCAIDPGIRKFQTIYSPDNENYTIIGDKASLVLYNKLLKLDKLLSKASNKNKLKILKLRLNIENLQSELHNKTASFLCENYKNIYIPKLTKDNDIINKTKRKINTKTVRNMVVLGHCKFIEKLKTKADLYNNVKVNIITEEYTSQKCLKCKKLTKTAKEIYVCESCNFTIDRDVLGSTNILLKNW